MLIVVSPAKKLNFESDIKIDHSTLPLFSSKTFSLAKELKKLAPIEIKRLMKLSNQLSQLNFERYQNFQKKSSPKKPAVYAFNGDTYTGLDIQSFNKVEITSAQKHLRILSGLYGVLRPLDLIEPYRLEMGTKFQFNTYKNLYDYWQDEVTAELNKELAKEKYLINCASQEYFKVVDAKKLKGKVITPIFKERRNNELKIISFSAKKARGMMASYILKNKITTPKELQAFDKDGYHFSKELSNESEYIFVR